MSQAASKQSKHFRNRSYVNASVDLVRQPYLSEEYYDMKDILHHAYIKKSYQHPPKKQVPLREISPIAMRDEIKAKENNNLPWM